MSGCFKFTMETAIGEGSGELGWRVFSANSFFFFFPRAKSKQDDENQEREISESKEEKKDRGEGSKHYITPRF